MPGKHRAVSVAEKRAEYAAKGLEWPKYPDGTDQLWSKDQRSPDGGHFKRWICVTNDRKRCRERSDWRRKHPGKCLLRGCGESRFRFTNGNYHTGLCSEHKRLNDAEYHARPHVRAEKALRGLNYVRIRY